MSKALYRKYRSKKLSEVVGQNHITTVLESALKQNRIAHAYLFTGPRGVGKTSIARILAHEINKITQILLRLMPPAITVLMIFASFATMYKLRLFLLNTVFILSMKFTCFQKPLLMLYLKHSKNRQNTLFLF